MTWIILLMIYQIIQVAIKKWGSVCLHHNFLNFKTRPALSINCVDIESLTLEIISEKTRNTIVSVLYRRPYSRSEYFENFLTNFFFKYKKL